jgi:hypothetical protein
MSKCSFGDGVVIKPDGVHELEPCIWETIERYKNVTIEVRKCINCGDIEVVWFRQDNTEREEIDNGISRK